LEFGGSVPGGTYPAVKLGTGAVIKPSGAAFKIE
jgi:hypothetical protein